MWTYKTGRGEEETYMKLPEKWIKYLIKQPEEGMGYQRVDVTFDDGTELIDCFVFNCEEIGIRCGSSQIDPKKKIKTLKIHPKTA